MYRYGKYFCAWRFPTHEYFSFFLDKRALHDILVEWSQYEQIISKRKQQDGRKFSIEEINNSASCMIYIYL